MKRSLTHSILCGALFSNKTVDPTPSMKGFPMNSFVGLRACSVILLLAGVTLSSRAADEASPPASEKRYLPWEKGSVSFGGFAAAFDSTLSFGRSRTGGISFNA